MKASTLYRIASVLLLLFAVGHTLGFRKIEPAWGVDALIGSMRSIHFLAQGSNRTYWDFYEGFGYFVSAFLLFSAVFAWLLASLPAAALTLMRPIAWAFAICFVAVTVLSWQYFFIVPVVFSAVISLVLIAAAWLSSRLNDSSK